MTKILTRIKYFSFGLSVHPKHKEVNVTNVKQAGDEIIAEVTLEKLKMEVSFSKAEFKKLHGLVNSVFCCCKVSHHIDTNWCPACGKELLK